jgi:hypothetical protein
MIIAIVTIICITIIMLLYSAIILVEEELATPPMIDKQLIAIQLIVPIPDVIHDGY